MAEAGVQRPGSGAAGSRGGLAGDVAGAAEPGGAAAWAPGAGPDGPAVLLRCCRGRGLDGRTGTTHDLGGEGQGQERSHAWESGLLQKPEWLGGGVACASLEVQFSPHVQGLVGQ